MTPDAAIILEARRVSCSGTSDDGAPSSLRDVSIGIGTGTFDLFCGTDPCGKNLLLRLLGLLETPEEGGIFFHGAATRLLPEETRAELRNRHYGFVFAQPYLLPSFAVVENVAMPLFKISGVGTDEARTRTRTLLQFTCMEELAEATVGQLALAQQHRVSLARALVNQPEILIVENVDATMSGDDLFHFVEIIRRACDEFGVTVLMTAKEKNLAKFADRVIGFAGGSIFRDSQAAVKTEAR